MTLQDAIKLVSPGDPFLRNMVKALESMPYLNTQDDNLRLQAAKLVLRNRRKIKFIGGKERYAVID